MKPRSYRLELVCPRCSKKSEQVVWREHIVAAGKVVANCGDCLWERMEIVPMTVTHVDVVEGAL